MLQTVLVVAGGDCPDPAHLIHLPPYDFCIAADHGADHAVELGLAMDLLVGDLDSIQPQTLQECELRNLEIERHEADKDRSDLQIAMDRAIARDPDQIIVLGTAGGRIDHWLTNIMTVAAVDYKRAQVYIHENQARITVLHPRSGPLEIVGRQGELFTLLAIGTARGVTVRGVEYPLESATLNSGTSLGLSNRFLSPKADFSLTEGSLLVIQPYAHKRSAKNSDSDSAKRDWIVD